MASLPSGMFVSARTLGGLAGLLLGARLSRGTNIPLMLGVGAVGYIVAGGML